MEQENPPEVVTLRGKRVLFILPPHDFRDEEYSVPKAFLEKSGARVSVASSSLSPVKGMLGTVVAPDISVETLNAGDFDAVLLVGGVGSSKFWHSATVHRIVKEAHDAGKVVSAICLAPVTLANAGLLLGKRATAYPSAGSFLEWKGALYTGKAVETADNIITARGPDAAEEFARTVAKSMMQNDSAPETTPDTNTQSEVSYDKE
jgi:protease I